MKNCLTRLAVSTGLILSLFAAPPPAFAGAPAHQMPGLAQPPAENPHPPQSAEDKRRVAFAEQVIEFQLRKIAPLSAVSDGLNPPFQDKDLACLQNPACYEKDLAYVQELKQLQDNYGRAVEVRHAHVIPWSFQKFLLQHDATKVSPGAAKVAAGPPMQGPQLKSDEYMIHTYVKFSNTGTWNHLDVIVTEDSSGNLAFRHFFTLSMPPDVMHIPPGVVC